MTNLSNSHSFSRPINKGFLALLMFIVSSSSVTSAMMVKNALKAPPHLGAVTLVHANNGFTVQRGGQDFPIQRAYMDKKLRGISSEKLLKHVIAGSYLTLNKIDGPNEYSLRMNGRLNGGGYWGATIGAYAGKAVVSLAGHGTIAVIAFCSGPLAIPVTIALESTFGPAIEAASIAGAVLGGIAGGTATGLV